MEYLYIGLGILIGLAAGPLWIAPLWIANYKKILLSCSRLQTPEKLGAGFFYIVPESDFNSMKASQSVLVRRQALREALDRRIRHPVPHA